VMTMVAQLAGSKSSIPNVSYLKAVDLWMMMGMVFVFAALIEYAILNSLERHAKQKTQKPGDYKVGIIHYRTDSRCRNKLVNEFIKQNRKCFLSRNGCMLQIFVYDRFIIYCLRTKAFTMSWMTSVI